MVLLSLCSANCRGIRGENKRKGFFNHIRQQKIDFCCVQETHMIPDDAEIWEQQWGGSIIYNCGKSNAHGVAILINNKWKDQVETMYKDKDGRVIIIKITDHEGNIDLVLACMYTPHTDDPQFFINAFEQAKKIPATGLILMGDMNFVLNPEIDRNENVQYHPQAVKTVCEYMENNKWVDCFRSLNPDTKKYSYIRVATNTASRLDYAFCDQSVLNQMTHCDYVWGYRLDHYFMNLSVSYNHIERGPGYWKFNNLLLQDTQFTDEAKNIIKNNLESKVCLTADNKWELLKQELIYWSQSYSKNKTRLRNQEKKEITKKLTEIKKFIDNGGNLDPLTTCEYVDLDTKLKEIEENKFRAIAFRSKALWYREGEKSSKCYFSLEKRNYLTKTMSKLVLEDGRTITNTQSILNAQYEFYKDLYKADNTKKFELTNESDVAVMECDKKFLDSDLTFKEATGHWPKVINVNIIHVADILDEQREFVMYNELPTKVRNVMTWFQYTQLCDAIPKKWLTLIRSETDNPKFTTPYKQVATQKKRAVYVYKKLCHSINGISRSLTKMQKKYKLDQENYTKAFKNLYQTTNATKYRDFQFRLLHDNIFANDRLYHWKKAPSQTCEWCDHKQTPIHMLLECKTVNFFWTELHNFLTMDLGLPKLLLEEENIILNTAHERPQHINNFIMLTAKYYIYTCKIKSTKSGLCRPDIFSYLRLINHLYHLELYNANQSNRMKYHEDKWAPLYNDVNTE